MATPGDRAFAQLQRAHQAFTPSLVARVFPTLTGADRGLVLAREEKLDAIYLRRARQRLAAINRLPPTRRRDRARKLIDREMTYLGQHIEQATRRITRDVEFFELRDSGATHAYWVLDPRLRNHTTDCRVMEGHVWPMSVLKVVNPSNRHAGCGCRLISVDRARALGLPLTRGYRTQAM